MVKKSILNLKSNYFKELEIVRKPYYLKCFIQLKIQYFIRTLRVNLNKNLLFIQVRFNKEICNS